MSIPEEELLRINREFAENEFVSADAVSRGIIENHGISLESDAAVEDLVDSISSVILIATKKQREIDANIVKRWGDFYIDGTDSLAWGIAANKLSGIVKMIRRETD